MLAGLFMAWVPTCSALALRAQPSMTTRDMEQIRAEHQHLLDELNGKEGKAGVLELNDPRVPELFKKGWDLAGDWASAYLESHEGPSTPELGRIFEGFVPKVRAAKAKNGDIEDSEYVFSGGAVRIGPAAYVVQARYSHESSIGTFMVVTRNRDGRFQVLWNIKDLAEKHFALRDEIGRWEYLTRRAYYSGPLDVERVVALSQTASGHARFLVNAYQSADGGPILGQLSIWEWDGAEAKPLLIETYQYAADYAGFRYRGKTIQITIKENPTTFFSCGMCPDPQGVWTLRVTPTGIENLGHHYLQPEYQWVNELLAQIRDGKDSSEIAATQVTEAIHGRMLELEEEYKKLEESAGNIPFSWGMFEPVQILRRGMRGAFIIKFDEMNLRLDYILRDGKPYFTKARVN